jgi:hypothetical protein
MPRKIHIDNRLNAIVEMTGEGMQAPHEHFGFYDMPAMYMPEMPAYDPPVQPEWFDMPIAPTPQPVMHEPVVELQPEPEMVSYTPDPISPEMFQALMQQVSAEALSGPLEPLDVHDVAQVNRVLIDHGVEPMGSINGVPLEESLIEIENEIFLAQNGPVQMQQMINPFGAGPML